MPQGKGTYGTKRGRPPKKKKAVKKSQYGSNMAAGAKKLKKGGKSKKRGTKGKCTPITKKGCTGRAKALAKTFKKMAKKRKKK